MKYKIFYVIISNYFYYSIKKEFIQIVEPLTIRPREGDSVTGYTKLRKTMSVVKVGKKVVRNYHQNIKEVRCTK